MGWFFAGFFGFIALCAILYLVARLKDSLAPKIECEAVVEKRYTENFPLTMGFVKRDRQEKYLTFQLEDGNILDFPVSDDLYKLCPAGTKGVLIYRGKRLMRFDVTAFTGSEDQLQF